MTHILRRAQRPALLAFAGVAITLGVVLGAIGPLYVIDSSIYLAIFGVVGLIVLLASQFIALRRRSA